MKKYKIIIPAHGVIFATYKGEYINEVKCGQCGAKLRPIKWETIK